MLKLNSDNEMEFNWHYSAAYNGHLKMQNMLSCQVYFFVLEVLVRLPSSMVDVVPRDSLLQKAHSDCSNTWNTVRDGSLRLSPRYMPLTKNPDRVTDNTRTQRIACHSKKKSKKLPYSDLFRHKKELNQSMGVKCRIEVTHETNVIYCYL